MKTATEALASVNARRARETYTRTVSDASVVWAGVGFIAGVGVMSVWWGWRGLWPWWCA